MIPARAVVLDMDGLMVDSEPLWFEVERAFAKRRGGDFDAEHARLCVGKGLASTLRFMTETFGFATEPEADAAEIVDDFIANVASLELKPGCRELLDAARGRVPLALASSSPERLIAAVVERFDLARWLDAIVSGERVSRPKPAPDVFLLAASRIRTAPGDCVVLEDSLAGATAGRAAGMRVIAVPEGDPRGRGFEQVSDAIVRDLHEARALLELLEAPK
jgi:HAD superfamily hydrolase (TIGR01509 family)